MPQPTVSQVHIDQALTNISVAYIQDREKYISGQIFPRVPVDKKSDLYWVYDKNDWFRDEAQKRASLTESAGGGYKLGQDSYNTEVWAYHKDVGPQERANADTPLDMDKDATEFVIQKLLLRLELQWITDYFGPTIWGTDVTPAALWDNYATSDPIHDIRLGIRTVLATTGFKPNTLVLGYDVWLALIDHPDIVDRIKYSSSPGSPALVNKETLAKVFDIERVFVSEAIKATNIEGAAPAYTFALGKGALLAYSAKSPGLMQPSAGYQFWWKGASHGMGTEVVTYRIPIPLLGLGAERIESEIAFVNKKVAADMGYMFNAVVG